MIIKVEAVNYRCLKNISRPLDRFHVMAGPNGAGKSTFLEVLKVLGAFASDGLDSVWAESKANHLSELLFCGRGTSFQLAVELQSPPNLFAQLGRTNNAFKRCIRYEVEIGRETETETDEPRILAENLWMMDKPTDLSRRHTVQQLSLFPSLSLPNRSLIHGQSKTPTGWRKVAAKSKKLNAYFRSETSDWNFTLKNPPQRSALSTLPEDERFGLASWTKTTLTQKVQKLMLKSESMQRPCPPLKDRRFLPDGSTLPFVVHELKQNPKMFGAWLKQVQTILPIRNIEVIKREEDKHSYLQVTYDSGLKVSSWHLSDGTLRMLALTLIPYIESEGDIYLIEEPENGVHPPAVEAIYKSLNSIYGGQALIATHSPVLVGLIDPNQLLCFSQTSDGEIDIVSGDQHPKLKNWQQDFRLAQLFASGILS
ncbi:MAG: AAA family ATPase [bacterium]|nr:AAA family ATPase [bacterium]